MRWWPLRRTKHPRMSRTPQSWPPAPGGGTYSTGIRRAAPFDQRQNDSTMTMLSLAPSPYLGRTHLLTAVVPQWWPVRRPDGLRPDVVRELAARLHRIRSSYGTRWATTMPAPQGADVGHRDVLSV